MGSANERRRYIVTPPLIGRAHTRNDPCLLNLSWRMTMTWCPSRYKDDLSTYGNFRYKDKTVVRLSYLNPDRNILIMGNSFTGKTTFDTETRPCLIPFLNITPDADTDISIFYHQAWYQPALIARELWQYKISVQISHLNSTFEISIVHKILYSR